MNIFRQLKPKKADNAVYWGVYSLDEIINKNFEDACVRLGSLSHSIDDAYVRLGSLSHGIDKIFPEESNIMSIVSQDGKFIHQLNLVGVSPERVETKLTPDGKTITLYVDGKSYRVFPFPGLNIKPEHVTATLEHGQYTLSVSRPRGAEPKVEDEIAIPLGKKQFLQEEK